MNVSLAEFKSDIDRYLKLVKDEEVVLIEDGKRIAKITPEPKGLAEYLTSLQGLLPETATLEEAREERIGKHVRHL